MKPSFYRKAKWSYEFTIELLKILNLSEPSLKTSDRQAAMILVKHQRTKKFVVLSRTLWSYVQDPVLFVLRRPLSRYLLALSALVKPAGCVKRKSPHIRNQ